MNAFHTSGDSTDSPAFSSSLSRRSVLSGLRAGALWAGASMVLAACAGGTDWSQFSTQDKADIARVEHYLNTAYGLKGQFIHIWPNKTESQGVISYEPGHLRLDYAPPHRRLAVAGNEKLVFYDYDNQARTEVGLASDPVGLLLDVPVKLGGPILVSSIQRRPQTLQISLARADNPSQGLLTLQFSDVNGRLSFNRIEGVDVRGNRNRFLLYNVTLGNHFPANWFSFPSDAG